MFRQATRLIARPSGMRAIPRASAPARRFLSTAPPTQKSRSWKSLVARLGVAGAIIYYYNTTEVFAEEPKLVVQSLPETHEETELLPTFESLAQEREKRKADLLAAQEKAAVEAKAKEAQASSVGGVEGLEEEADQQGAFNPETGEINWDCPCLGGMANGPCGEEFKAAFSCFIFSTEEPKGMDCIENFKHMQNCFRQYPEVYGAELDQDEEDDVPADGELSAATATETPATELSNVASQPTSESSKLNESQDERGLVPKSYRSGVEQTEDSKAQAKRQVESLSESEDERIIPKAAQDEGDAKLGKK